MSSTLEFHMGNYSSKVIFSNEFRLPEFKGKLLFIFDTNTVDIFGKDIKNSIILKPGEENKSWKSIEKVMKRAVELELARDCIFIGVGGGLLCDLTAYAASIYMRGCKVVLVPTTLLSMVDASIGGKTGMNYMGYKNMIGTFYPAEEIHICFSALKSLSEREYHTGLAEVIKTAMLGDKELFELLNANYKSVLSRDPETVEEIVKRCVAVKGRIVEEDLREKGIRAFLNLGHTFGHALEFVSGFTGWSHGEAVAWGIARAMELGMNIGITNTSYGNSVKELLELYGFRIIARGINSEQIVKAMNKDKKKLKGHLRFVLQTGLCETKVLEVEQDKILKAIK